MLAPMDDAHVVVLFGAMGDLARRKLLPGLLHLFLAGMITDFRVVGTSLEDVDDAAFVEHTRQAVAEFSTRPMTDEQWTRLTDVNLRGNWLCSQVVCRRLVAEKRPGSIVNIGSIQAAKVLPGRTHYAPTKLGLEALTRNMSAEMTPLGIRVNCVHPGLIETDMTDWVMKSPDILPLVLAQISMGRAGQPREIGTVVAFFASDEAAYLTGQSVHVDGGWAGK